VYQSPQQNRKHWTLFDVEYTISNITEFIAYSTSTRGLQTRHKTASLMLNHGIPVLIASKRLGHSKPSVTIDIYGHLMPSKQEEAAALIDTLISPIDEK